MFQKLLFMLFLTGAFVRINSSLIESSLNLSNEENVCDFENRLMAETVRFVRSPYSCRVYHVCAFYKQYTLTCPDGLYFDLNLDACNFREFVYCNLDTLVDNITETNVSTEIFDITTSKIFLETSTTELANDPTIVSSTIQTTTLTESQNLTESIFDFYSNTTNFNYISNTTSIQTNAVPVLASTSIPELFNITNYLDNSNTSNSVPEIQTQANSVPISTTTSFIFNIINSTQYLNTTQVVDDFLKQTESTSFLSTTEFTEPTFTTTTYITPTDKAENSTVPSISIPLIYHENSDLNNSWWLGPVNCIVGFEHKISNKDNCALYFECSKTGEKTEKSCPYPLQFDEMLNECRMYDLVDCGSRKSAKDLCDYKISNTKFNFIPCELYPSCKRLSDGLYPSNDCRHYYQCKDERTLRVFTCPKDKNTGAQLKFNFMTKRCDDIENVSFNCGGYSIPIDVYTNKMVCPAQDSIRSNFEQLEAQQQPSLETRDLYFSHPKDCNVYLACDQNGNMTVLECLNGTHFSPYYQSCVHPSVANCKKYHTMDETPINFSLRVLLLEKSIKTLNYQENEQEDSNLDLSQLRNNTANQSINLKTRNNSYF